MHNFEKLKINAENFAKKNYPDDWEIFKNHLKNRIRF
jgi:hypothetical protein